MGHHLAAGAVVWGYNAGVRGIRAVEWLLKVVIVLIVFSFIGVVVLSANGALDWGAIAAGFLPD